MTIKIPSLSCLLILFSLCSSGLQARETGSDCPQAKQQRIFLAGLEDEFLPPFEAASPSQEMLDFIADNNGTAKDFDDAQTNRFFGHTFTGIPPGVLAAMLEVRLMPAGSDFTSNDNINLELTGLVPAFAWGSRISALTPDQSWQPGGDAQTFMLDLGPQGLNILRHLEDGDLDVFVQDDTKVDHIRLRVEFCPCEFPEVQTIRAGEDDGFQGGQEPSSPRPELLAFIQGLPNLPQRQFDDFSSNRVFGHTFAGLPRGIVSARLELHLGTSSTGQINNDSINLDLNPPGSASSFAASFPLSDLANSQTVTRTLVLDEAVLSSMTDGKLDVLIQDDTGVDFMELTLEACSCRELRLTRRGGLPDGFSGGTERARPSADLRDFIPGEPLDFDEADIDRFFGHTFVGLPARILHAELTVGLMAAGSSGSFNDNLVLQLVRESDRTFAWQGRIAELSGISWTGNAQATLRLDLSNLPPSPIGVTDILDRLSSGRLDVVVQDDTKVDFITLNLVYCAPVRGPIVVTPSTGSGIQFNNQQILLFNDSSTVGASFPVFESEGICLFMDPVCVDAQGSALELTSQGEFTEGVFESTLAFENAGAQAAIRTDFKDFQDVPCIHVQVCDDQGRIIASACIADGLIATLPLDACVQEVDDLRVNSQSAGFQVILSQPARISINGAGTFEGSRIKAFPDFVVGIEERRLQRFDLQARNLPRLIINDATIQVAQMSARPSGEAVLSPSPDGLRIANLGSSGEDGFSISGRVPELRLGWFDLCPFLHPAVDEIGASLRVAGVGSIAGLGGQPLAEVQVEAVEGSLRLSGDFSGLGAATQRVECYNQGELVAAADGRSGLLASLAFEGQAEPWPNGLFQSVRCTADQGDLTTFRTIIVDDDAYCIGAFWDQPEPITIPGVGTFQADEVRILADGPSQDVELIERFEVSSVGISEFLIRQASQDAFGLGQSLFLAQFGNGQDGPDQLASQILLINPDEQNPARVRINLRDGQGEPLQTRLNGLQADKAFNAVIPPGSLRLFESDGQGAVISGSAVIESDRELGGVILFGGSVGVAGVGTSPRLSGEFAAMIESRSSDGINTGIALMNLESSDVAIDLVLQDADGNSLAQAQVILPGQGHLARFVDEIDWGAALNFDDFLGLIRASASGAVSATVLQTRPGELVTLPVAPATIPEGIQAPAQQAENALIFAHFGEGEGLLFSQIALLNLSSQSAANARIVLRDDDGNPLPVDLNGVATDGEVDALIPPSGLRLFRTDGQGELSVGSVRVFSDQPLVGVILFAGSVGAAGVGQSALLTDGLLAPMINQRGEGIRTGIAIVNLDEAMADIELSLCDSEGELLAATSVELPADGHLARFVDEFDWNPQPGVVLDFSDFQGILKTGTGGRIAATVIQSRPNRFATLPVIAR